MKRDGTLNDAEYAYRASVQARLDRERRSGYPYWNSDEAGVAWWQRRRRIERKFPNLQPDRHPAHDALVDRMRAHREELKALRRR